MKNQIIDFSLDQSVSNCESLKLADTPPPWRRYQPKSGELKPRVPRAMLESHAQRGRTYIGREIDAQVISAALILRRPLLVTGPAGVGKSTLAYAVAWRLGLGNVLRWGITSRTTLKDGLYHYDAIGRLHQLQTEHSPNTAPGAAGVPAANQIGQYIRLGPLGTALLPTQSAGYFPRALLIDEIDKGDADLPADLLHVFEEGSFQIPEIGRLGRAESVSTDDPYEPVFEVPGSGWVQCDDFPFVVMTSNGEREFPPAFLRRCLQLEMKLDEAELIRVLGSHLEAAAVADEGVRELLKRFEELGARRTLATDQLLNAAFLLRSGTDLSDALKETVFRSLSSVDAKD